MLIVLEDYTINDLVLACPGIVDANGNAHFDSGFHGLFVENLAAPAHISDRFTEAIVHRSTGLLKNDCTARTVLSDFPVSSVAAVVVVVVCWFGFGTSWVFISGCRRVCPHANDATTAKAVVNSIFFMISSSVI